MRSRGLLHAELARVVAEMGHGQRLCIADAGLPVPHGVARIALGYAPGQPAMLDVLTAVLDDLVVESAIVATELAPDSRVASALGVALEAVGAPVEQVPHEQFKELTASCSAVVQTGEFTPYANVILIAGVAF